MKFQLNLLFHSLLPPSNIFRLHHHINYKINDLIIYNCIFAIAGVGEVSKLTQYNVTITKNKILEEYKYLKILQRYEIFKLIIKLLKQ